MIKAAMDLMRKFEANGNQSAKGEAGCTMSAALTLAHLYLAEHPADEDEPLKGMPDLSKLLECEAVRRMKWNDDGSLTLRLAFDLTFDTRDVARQLMDAIGLTEAKETS